MTGEEGIEMLNDFVEREKSFEEFWTEFRLRLLLEEKRNKTTR